MMKVNRTEPLMSAAGAAMLRLFQKFVDEVEKRRGIYITLNRRICAREYNPDGVKGF